MMTQKVTFVLVLLYIQATGGEWVNNYDEDAVIDCQDQQYLSYIGSVHKNSFEDRIWRFRCRPPPGEVYDCDWTTYLNDFDKVLNYTCPGNSLINGMMSYNDNHYRDRRFLVKCCLIYPRSTTNCSLTNFINDWDREMSYTVPEGKCIKGVYSIHDNGKEDRRWKFNICDLV